MFFHLDLFRSQVDDNLLYFTDGVGVNDGHEFSLALNLLCPAFQNIPMSCVCRVSLSPTLDVEPRLEPPLPGLYMTCNLQFK